MDYENTTSPQVSPYWRQYAWIGNELKLKGEKAVVFALIYERDCTDSPDAGRITSRYIADALAASGNDQKHEGIRGVFRVLNGLASSGLVTAEMDNERLTMMFRCDAAAVEKALRAAEAPDPTQEDGGEEHGQ